MVVSVLVMTPVRSFGELIQQALQETGLYRVALVGDAVEALECVGNHQYPVAVFDFDLDPDPAALVEAAYKLDADLRIVALKDETDASTSALEGLRLAQHLNTLFYLPDLLDAMEVVTADLVHLSTGSAEDRSARAFPSGLLDLNKKVVEIESPGWLEDVSLAAIHLTRLSLESVAQAALITRNAQLWAYAGHLPHPAAEELAQFVGNYWQWDGGGDFARFIRLDAITGEYILYATGLGGEYVLALAFEPEIPFTKIRSQAKGLAHKLVSAPQIVLDEPEDGEAEAYEFDLESESDAIQVAGEFMLEESEAEIIEFPNDWRPYQEMADSRQAFFEDLLATVEIPEPDGEPLSTTRPGDALPKGLEDRVPVDTAEPGELNASQESDAEEELTQRMATSSERPGMHTGSEGIVTQPTVLSEEGVNGSNADTGGTVMADTSEGPEQETTRRGGAIPNYLAETLATPLPEYLKDTLPTPTRGFREEFRGRQVGDGEALEIHPVYSQLTYACVLVPKLSPHHLVGELAEFLSRCVVQVVKAFGWRLEHLAIRPDYLHWVIAIPPGTSPGYMVRIMRDHASHRIFTQYPGLAQENQTGDFWASGYLIVNGKFPLSHQLVEDFIHKIRLRQVQPHHHSLTDI